MGIVNALGGLYFKGRYKKITSALQNCIKIQDSLRQELIEQNANTDFGKAHLFREIFDLKSFQKNIPIRTYEEFYPYIEQMIEGKQKITWDSNINWFAKSSGTTNSKSKFIPISYENLENCHFEAGKDVLCIHYHRNPESKLFQGKGLLIGGSNQTNPLSKGSSYGDLSAVLMNEMPLWANLAKTPDLSIALMEDWDEKVIKMAEATIQDNVTSISGVPTWTIVLLRKVLELSGKKTISEVWPNFELFVHGGISFEPYRETFLELIGHSNVSLLETYNASEGFFGLQLIQGENMTLMPQYGIFYEFLNLENGEIIDISKIEENTNYELIITTNSGLWRYRIGDTLLFTNKEKLQFVITGRTKHFINAFGEELMVHNADEALKTVCKNFNVSLIDYTAAPLQNISKNEAIGTHEWLICIDKEISNEDDFKAELDSQLQKVNSDYEAKRKGNLAMSFPKITIVKQKVFENWLRSKNKLGGQHKVPRLSNDRKTLEDVKRVNNLID